MCGIAGFNLSPTDRGNLDVRVMAEALLSDIVSRGRDATGAAWFDPDTGACMVQKNDDAATKFVTYMEIPEGATNAIFHTRASTKGSPHLNENNHPIVTRNLVGVHNGTIRNDDEIFEKIGEDKRTAQVDSEAIFAAINFGHWVVNGKPVISDNLLDILGTLKGGAAIAWLQYDKPNDLHLSRLSGSPLVVAHTKGGSLLFASTSSAIRSAARKAGVELRGNNFADETHDIKEGVYLKVVDGEIVSTHEFTPATKNAGEDWKRSSGYSSTTTTKAKDKTKDKDKDKDKNKVQTSTTTTKSAGSAGTGPKTPSAKTPTTDTPAGGQEWMLGDNGEVLPLSQLREADVDSADVPALERAIEAIHVSLVEAVGTVEEPITPAISASDKRLTTIANYVDGLSCKDDDKEFFKVTNDLGAWLEEGDWCLTEAFGTVDVPAQIVSLPLTFPGGDYVLRLYIQNSEVDGGYETAVVTRKLGEFIEVSPVDHPLVSAVEDEVGQAVDILNS